MNISLLGGAGEVGRSAYLVSSNGKKFVFDYGMQLEPITYPIPPGHVDAVFLSHAHLDHCGNLAWLYKTQRPAVYGTDMTFSIAELLMYDSLKVQKLRKEQSTYAERDVESLLQHAVHVGYDKVRKMEGAAFEFFDAGHIPGSCSVMLDADGRKVLYSGDLNTRDTLLLEGARPPKADVLILESTYGNRIHPDRQDTVNEFLGVVESTLDSGGVVVVPAFAVGRSQEVLMMLKEYPNVYFDGMGRDVTRLFLQSPEWVRDPDLLQMAANNAYWVENHGQRRKIVKEPSIIVTTAGMLTGGPVVDYIKRLRNDTRSSILLTGYQVEGTNGRLLVDEGYILDNMQGKKYGVNMQVHHFDFSAHADQDDLVKVVKDVSPEEVILVHGDGEATRALAESLSGYTVHTPSVGDSITLG